MLWTYWCGGITVYIRLVSNSSSSYKVKINMMLLLHCTTAERMGILWLSGVRRAILPGDQLMLFKRGLPYLSPQTTWNWCAGTVTFVAWFFALDLFSVFGKDTTEENCRPILLLSVASKILERHIHGKIFVHLQSAYPLSASRGILFWKIPALLQQLQMTGWRWWSLL